MAKVPSSANTESFAKRQVGIRKVSVVAIDGKKLVGEKNSERRTGSKK